jgi:hypothetical protein
MSGVRIFLGASALVWLPYGIYCFLHPDFLAGAAGVQALNPTGLTELRAMYGGLQAAIGAFALLGFFSQGARGTVLLALAFLTAGLGSARAIGVFVDGGVSSYTAAGVLFEWLSTGLAVHFARRD